MMRGRWLAMAGMALLAGACTFSHWRNRAALPRLQRGMSMDEVRAVMGEPVVGEAFCRPEVWFYYTDPRWSDGNITSDECTPLVFENGRLSGWGRAYYRDYLHRDWGVKADK